MRISKKNVYIRNDNSVRQKISKFNKEAIMSTTRKIGIITGMKFIGIALFLVFGKGLRDL